MAGHLDNQNPRQPLKQPKMFVIYNILQLVFLVVFWPFIALFVLGSAKYRNRVPARLGIGLKRKMLLARTHQQKSTGPTIWLHALSVGEVTSSVPLLTGLRKSFPGCRIIVSVSTRAGKQLANTLLQAVAEQVIDGPYDLLPTVYRFVKCIRPDLFILVETDFWPNILLSLQHRKIPAILVNGRVSAGSMAGYRRLPWFFKPMFQSFAYLCMQTRQDAENMQKLGLPAAKTRTLGNLKFDTAITENNHLQQAAARFLAQERIHFICGSTHPGEEKILIRCYNELKNSHPELFLTIAPRDTGRAKEIQSLAASHGLNAALRSADSPETADMLILDTIGELVRFYAFSHIAFVGGSLVEKGGHNPIEPATMAIPVIFGPNMQDFVEIAEALISCEGAVQVVDQKELADLLTELLSSAEERTRRGLAAQHCVASRRGVIDKHLELIRQLL